MAVNNSSLVTVGKPVAAGAISAGEANKNVPTDATTALKAGIAKLGYVSDDGLTNSVEVDTEEIKAWGGDTVLTVRTSRTETFSWTFIQTLDADVLKEVYGPENVSGTPEAGLTILHNSKDMPRRLYVFEMLMTGGYIKRIVVPNAQITEVGDVQYVDGEAVGYKVTLTCFPDATGNTVTEYIAKPVAG